MPNGVLTSARATEHRKCVPTDALAVEAADEGALPAVAAPPAPALALPLLLPFVDEDGVATAPPPLPALALP